MEAAIAPGEAEERGQGTGAAGAEVLAVEAERAEGGECGPRNVTEKTCGRISPGPEVVINGKYASSLWGSIDSFVLTFYGAVLHRGRHLLQLRLQH